MRDSDVAREAYEAPELTVLAKVEDATLSSLEGGGDAMSLLSASQTEQPPSQ